MPRKTRTNKDLSPKGKFIIKQKKNTTDDAYFIWILECDLLTSNARFTEERKIVFVLNIHIYFLCII